jgi:hypothetical protein
LVTTKDITKVQKLLQLHSWHEICGWFVYDASNTI